MAKPTLPEWAEEWIPAGRCGCGGRLVRPICYCGDHVACAASGWGVDKCPLPKQAAATDR